MPDPRDEERARDMLHREVMTYCDCIERARTCTCAAAIAQALTAARQEGAREAYERAAQEVEAWLRPSKLRLHAGEMKAQEERTAIAVLRARAAAIRALAQQETR